MGLEPESCGTEHQSHSAISSCLCRCLCLKEVHILGFKQISSSFKVHSQEHFAEHFSTKKFDSNRLAINQKCKRERLCFLRRFEQKKRRYEEEMMAEYLSQRNGNSKLFNIFLDSCCRKRNECEVFEIY
ncbi:hypothetical protein CEXT_804261 [Caerostris extrusa]|uniref:Uncharacterized protein n=1 Tax=Caerostris extrusa TaxID=172846 RepID=A0AAV4N4E5_CAEEX|nr:hypothetical protein CEXT_804261 [Caerostris extrusa]